MHFCRVFRLFARMAREREKERESRMTPSSTNREMKTAFLSVIASRSVPRFFRHLIVIVRVTRFSRRRGCPELAPASVECSIFLTDDGQTIRFSQVGTPTVTDIRLIFQLYQVTSTHLKALYLGTEVVENNIARGCSIHRKLLRFLRRSFLQRDPIFPISQMSKNLFGYAALSVD